MAMTMAIMTQCQIENDPMVTDLRPHPARVSSFHYFVDQRGEKVHCCFEFTTLPAYSRKQRQLANCGDRITVRCAQFGKSTIAERGATTVECAHPNSFEFFSPRLANPEPFRYIGPAAPASSASHNFGERDPAVMSGYRGGGSISRGRHYGKNSHHPNRASIEYFPAPVMQSSRKPPTILRFL
jgi:hypothetical protein